MKKYIFCFLSLLALSCSNDNDTAENPNANQVKIKTLTIKDEEVQNGNSSLYEKLDFEFEYNQDKLIKVRDIHGNYTEILSYNNNNLLTDIDITGYQYPSLADHYPLNVKQKLTYNNNNKLIKSEDQTDTYYRPYTTFEYPANDIIIAKFYSGGAGIQTVSKTSKIFFNNQNVIRVEIARNNSSIFTDAIKYEYDQKINPNSLIDQNRILGLPNFAFNIFMLQDYSQLSKNNVTKRSTYFIYPQEYLKTSLDIKYDYQNNSFPTNIYIDDFPEAPTFKASAVYGY